MYARPAMLENTGEVRLEIFRNVLRIWSNGYYQLGFPKEGAEDRITASVLHWWSARERRKVMWIGRT
jgi:hypothetical protein